jgi:cell division protein FtsB
LPRPRRRQAGRKTLILPTENTDIQRKDASTSGGELIDNTVLDLNEKNLEKSIKKGLSAPYAKVLLRLILVILVVTSLGMFVTGIMRYSELQREAEVLEKQKEALSAEVEELQYLLGCSSSTDEMVRREYVIRMAREKLGLYLPDEIIYYNDTNDKK